MNSQASVAYVKQFLPCDPLKRGLSIKLPSELHNFQLLNQEFKDVQNAGHQVRRILIQMSLFDGFALDNNMFLFFMFFFHYDLNAPCCISSCWTVTGLNMQNQLTAF